MATLWIIDAYNLIRNSRGFSGLEAEQPELGRQAALDWLADFRSVTGQGVWAIFDAYSGVHQKPIEKFHEGIKILESRGGYTADEEIALLARQKREGAVVVSSDKEVIEAAIQAGSSVLTSEEFEREVEKILAKAWEEAEEGLPNDLPKKGRAFQPPKEKKKAYQILRKYQ